eukprot:379084-Amphidinium_carterae.1
MSAIRRWIAASSCINVHDACSAGTFRLYGQLVQKRLSLDLSIRELYRVVLLFGCFWCKLREVLSYWAKSP